jgi:hypothetical protein
MHGSKGEIMPSSTNRRGIEIPTNLHAAMGPVAKRQDITLAQLAATAIWEYLKIHGGDPPEPDDPHTPTHRAAAARASLTFRLCEDQGEIERRYRALTEALSKARYQANDIARWLHEEEDSRIRAAYKRLVQPGG